MRTIALSIAALFAFVSASYADFQCPAGQPAWHAEKYGSHFYLYGTKALGIGSKLYLEHWRDGSLVWRVAPERHCKDGLLFCELRFPSLAENSKDKNDDEDQLVSTFQSISDKSEHPQYIVLGEPTSQSKAAVYYIMNVDWFEEISDESRNVWIPQVYDRIYCETKKDVPETETAAAINDNNDMGFFYLKAAEVAIKGGGISPDGLVEARLKGEMKTIYDCHLEVRYLCLQLLYASDKYVKSHKDQFYVGDWDEWRDAFESDQKKNEFWENNFKQAAQDGYNLFSNQELQKAAGVNFEKK
jgi:hypothetical protein